MSSAVMEFRLAVRRLIGERGLSIPAVATVAIGIGIAASVFALVDGVLIRPLPYPDPDRLVSIRHVAPGTELTRDRVSPGLFLHYRDGNRVFEAVAGYDPMSFTFTDGAEAERIRTAVVTPELFSVLQVVPQLGRVPRASDDRLDHSANMGTMGILLGHGLWVRRYGADPEILGRTIEIDGEPRAVVVGVARPGFSFPDPATEAWLVQVVDRVPWSRSASIREGLYMGAIARLGPGDTRERAEADLNRLVHALPSAFSDVTAADIGEIGLRAEVRPFKDEIVGDVRLTLLLVLASGAFLLLVTWANVANLLLLRAHGRRVEIGITRALGASEPRVALRFLCESLVLMLAGGLIGLALASAAIRSRFGFAPRQLPRLEEVGVDGAVIGLVAMIAVISAALMAGICLASTRQRVAGPALSALRSRSSTQGREGQTGRKVLVAAQLALALTLLVGSGLMVRSFSRLKQVNLGFRPDGVLTFFLPITHLGSGADYDDVAGLHDRVLGRLRAVPGVDAVEAATNSVFPLTLRGWDDLQRIARAEERAARVEASPLALPGYATPGYFEAMGIPFVAGRAFRSEDTSTDAPGVILSRSLARDLFGNMYPIGRRVAFAGYPSWADLRVIGVVGDVPGTTLREGSSRSIYLPHLYPPLGLTSRRPGRAASEGTEVPYWYMPLWETYVVRTDRDHASLVPELRRAVQEVDPRLPMLDIAAMDRIVAAATAQERVVMRLLLVSAATALFLGAVGIYGVLAYSARRRTGEIGIRVALGASPLRVTRLVVTHGAAVSAAGIAAGIVAAILLTRFVASLLYETSPTDPLTFAGVTLLLFGVALLASYIPARRASRIDPAQALRAE
ncbi:MAG: ABC transporter permease [Longimicrobiales bacterium]